MRGDRRCGIPALPDHSVTPAKAGVQACGDLDSRLRGNDDLTIAIPRVPPIWRTNRSRSLGGVKDHSPWRKPWGTLWNHIAQVVTPRTSHKAPHRS